MWHGIDLKESEPGVYKAIPPEPQDGHWTGYYVEIYFEGDTQRGSSMLNDKFSFSTPGYTWPNTLPFKDCSGIEGTCTSIIV